MRQEEGDWTGSIFSLKDLWDYVVKRSEWGKITDI